MFGASPVEILIGAGALVSLLFTLHKYADYLLNKHSLRTRSIVKEELKEELQPIKDATMKQREFEARTTLQLNRLNLGFDNLTTSVSQLKGWTEGFSAASGIKGPVWKDDLEGGNTHA